MLKKNDTRATQYSTLRALSAYGYQEKECRRNFGVVLEPKGGAVYGTRARRGDSGREKNGLCCQVLAAVDASWRSFSFFSLFHSSFFFLLSPPLPSPRLLFYGCTSRSVAPGTSSFVFLRRRGSERAWHDALRVRRKTAAKRKEKKGRELFFFASFCFFAAMPFLQKKIPRRRTPAVSLIRVFPHAQALKDVALVAPAERKMTKTSPLAFFEAPEKGKTNKRLSSVFFFFFLSSMLVALD